MGWFDILKVEDIDFDGSGEGFGHYAASTKPLGKETFDMIMSGKYPDLKDLIDEEIRINHHEINRYLKNKLNREPTERELMEFVTRAIMHESTHAGMGLEQAPMDNAAKEYGAFTGQFPDNIFYRLKSYLQHPATKTQIINPSLERALGIKGSVGKESIEEIKRFVAFAEALTDELDVNPKTRDKIRNKLARLEVTARTQQPDKTFSDVIEPNKVSTWVERYGAEHKDFFEKIYYHRSPNFSDEELKMAGAVTTTTSPAMFNKVVRGRKKRRGKDGRR